MKKIFSKKNIYSIFNTSSIIYRFISTILILNIFILAKNNFNYELSLVEKYHLPKIIIPIIIIFIIISTLNILIKQNYFDYLLTIVSLLVCSVFWIDHNNIFFALLLTLIFLLLYKFRPPNLTFKNKNISDKTLLIIVIIAIIIMLISTIGIGVFRYKTFSSPNFDLGIPGQNFYYLKKVGLPLSTCERDKLISHFAIHTSLIYYIILPIYLVFSSVLTLQVIGSIIITSGIIPIYLLCKKYKLSNIITAVICLIYAIYTPSICGTLYDFHENFCLLPFLLWLFYFYEKNDKMSFIVTLLLIIFIKEDSPAYLIIFGIFAIFDKKPNYGVPLIIFSGLCFITTKYILETYGEGIMSDRYSNLIYNDQGIFGIINTILVNPGYFIKQLIASDDGGVSKLKYAIELLLPLGFVPCIQKEKHNYILLLPILLTMMTTYEYSFNINFHYSFGIIAFLFYALIKSVDSKSYIFVCLISSILVFKAFVYTSVYNSIHDYYQNRESYQEMENFLKQIPEDASVSSSTFILPHIANRDILYEEYYHDNTNDVEYIVLDSRFDCQESLEKHFKNGYYIHSELPNKIIILKR